MFHSRDLLSTYNPIEGGVVLMGNNSTCKFIGIGTMKIKMHNEVVRTLTHVRYALDLKKNLISLGVLDANGCKSLIESKNIKISRGALVLMKGKKFDSLHTLLGSTITGSIAVSLSTSDSDSTKLWHMHLGHMSE